MKIIFFFISLGIFLFCLFSTNLSLWETFSVGLFVYLFLELILDMGDKLVILYLPIVSAVFTWLIMPIIFYHVYTPEDRLARMWGKYMPISSDEYFSFVLPATLTMIAGLRIRIGNWVDTKNPASYIENVKQYLAKGNNSSLGFKLIGIGLVSGLLDVLAVKSLTQLFYLLEHLTYVGVFYVLYSPSKYKRIIVPFVLALMVGQTIVTGMFGEFIFILALSLVLILLGTRIGFTRKLTYVASGIFLIIVLQSIKIDYRKRTWGSGADPLYYGELIVDRVTNPLDMFDSKKLFFVSVRMNQGWLVAMTMTKVPSKHPYANGETIWESVAASIVPRFLWPDKPEAGGKYNLRRFWGYNLRGYSMNIGPVGEAYGNFGITGGIVYMFFYGLFFNVVFSFILKLSKKRPTLILWLPFLFFYAISTETDLVTTMNSLVKASMFAWFVYWAFKVFFRTEL